MVDEQVAFAASAFEAVETCIAEMGTKEAINRKAIALSLNFLKLNKRLALLNFN